jgi:hypothetical protein
VFDAVACSFDLSPDFVVLVSVESAGCSLAIMAATSALLILSTTSGSCPSSFSLWRLAKLIALADSASAFAFCDERILFAASAFSGFGASATSAGSE